MQENASQLQNDCQSDSVRCEHRVSAARHDVEQTLLRASLPDFNDSRNRFIPLDQLRSKFDFNKIRELLRTTFGDDTPDFSSTDIAEQISPQTGSCPRCNNNVSCTGRRMIFISLFLLAKERLIIEFLKSPSPACDSTLPLRPAQRTESEEPAEGNSAAIEGLQPQDEDLFYHLQWKMRSPYFTFHPPPFDDFRRLDAAISLPWTEVNKLHEGTAIALEFSTVHKIRIHQDHHSLVIAPRFA